VFPKPTDFDIPVDIRYYKTKAIPLAFGIWEGMQCPSNLGRVWFATNSRRRPPHRNRVTPHLPNADATLRPSFGVPSGCQLKTSAVARLCGGRFVRPTLGTATAAAVTSVASTKLAPNLGYGLGY
jgi:hypothetical protein